ncbi:MAG TPA: hypothetical protein ENN19_09825 [Chloroflexi bacterium]|nr:hypothetical protein [Chloroflexota bacterium]
MPTFQNRQPELKKLIMDPGSLWNVYGEAGIGKSRLLEEFANCFQEDPPALVLKLDMKQVANGGADRRERLLRAMIAQAKDWIQGHWTNPEQAAGQIVNQLNDLTKRMPVLLLCDTTEVLQENMDFWRWMEAHVVGPLVVEGRVQQVFAGRVPVPWRRVEVRRALKLMPLTPLSATGAARDLIREVLIQENSDLEAQESLDELLELILTLSFGHPLLSKELASFMALRWPTERSPADVQRMLCQRVVQPIVKERFFKNVSAPWDEILRLASVLNWFDATILQRYLQRVAPTLIEDRSDYFFIQGITRLRIQNTVVWREERGDRLHGVIGDIVRHCFQVTEPEAYRQACLAAAETFAALADEIPGESPEAEPYYQEAESYRQRAEEMIQ